MSLELGVKFCGVTSREDIRKAERAGAKAFGVIVQPDGITHVPSPDSHTVSMARARDLREATPQELDFVLVPRSGGAETIADMMSELVPDRVQVGHIEDPALIAALRDSHGDLAEIAQVIHVGEKTQAAGIDVFLNEADYIHIDSEGPLPGGNARTPDLLRSRAIADRAHAAGRLVIFSGGLTKEIIPVVVKAVEPNGLDAESANRKFGVYNEKMMKEFADAAL